MKDFQQSDKGGIAKSQLTTLLWFLWIWQASRKSSSNTEVDLQIILVEWKLKVWSFSQQCLAIADLLVFRNQETNKSAIAKLFSFCSGNDGLTSSKPFCDLYSVELNSFKIPSFRFRRFPSSLKSECLKKYDFHEYFNYILDGISFNYRKRKKKHW